MEKVLKIGNMNCGHCEAKIDKALSALENTSARFDLTNKTVSVTTDLSDDVLIKAVADAGYTVDEIQ